MFFKIKLDFSNTEVCIKIIFRFIFQNILKHKIVVFLKYFRYFKSYIYKL